MTPITPELALIDPELAGAARALLHEPGQFRPTVPVRVHSRAGSVPVQGHSPATRRRLYASAVSVLGAVVVVVGALGLASGRPEAPPSLLQSRATLQATLARKYTWPAVPGAEAYAFTITRDRQPVYETTTRAPALELPAELTLAPGRYAWSATLQSSGTAANSPSRPVVEGTFEVRPA